MASTPALDIEPAGRGAVAGVAARLRRLPGRAPAWARRFGWPLLFLSPWVIGLLGLTVVPMGLSLYYSFTDFSLLGNPVWIGAANYTELSADPTFWQSTGNTLYLILIMVPVSTGAALAYALLLNQKVRGLRFFRTALYLPSLFPPVASALLWLWLLNPQFGLVDNLLAAVHVLGPPWLASMGWSKPALVIMQIWASGGAMVIFLAGLQGVPTALLEAAHLDGAGVWQRFRHVTLPSISPVILFNLVMGMIGALQYFTQAYVMGGAGSTDGVGGSLLFYAVYLYELAFQNLRVGYASALAWVMLAFAAALTAALFWTARRWVHYGLWR
jgi:multiple sugar transport system permease protein